MRGYDIHHNEFYELVKNPVSWTPAELTSNRPRTGRAGITLLFPFRAVDNFLGSIATELRLKKGFLSPKQCVCYLRLRGQPLRQLSMEQVTELLFRLCSRYRIQEADLGERRIDLVVGDCTSNHLALLRGLGFNHIHLLVDATIAAPDRGVDAIRTAVGNVRHFDGYRISAEVIHCPDTHRDCLGRLVHCLATFQADDIELFNLSTSSIPAGQLDQHHATFHYLTDVLTDAGYRLVGDRCFKRSDHPDLRLLTEGKLGYGPWGFYNLATTEWLGLGPGADGMIAGFMYHNSANAKAYQDHLAQQKSPVCGWSRNPMEREPAFRFIRDLYCGHRVPAAYFARRGPLLAKLKALKWLEEDNGTCVLTEGGILHLPAICNLYSLQESMGGTKAD